MAIEIDLQKHQTTSNSDRFANLEAVTDDNLKADACLRVGYYDHFEFVLFGEAIDTPDGEGEFGVSRRDEEDVFRIVEICRKEWTRLVVDFERSNPGVTAGRGTELPFQDRWNFRREPALLEGIGPSLALAGNLLFNLIFELNCDNGLKKLGRALRAAMSKKPLYLAITSNTFFLPWGMIYTHPVAGERLESNGRNWRKEGFWGYQHIVQQTTEKCDLQTKIRHSSGLVPLSINFDDTISGNLALSIRGRRIIDGHIKIIGKLGGDSCVKRTKKCQLEDAFKDNRDSLERVIYFYCHGRGSTDASHLNLEETQLVLTDGPVSCYDFQHWLNDEKMPTSPLIFVNACQGGQMTTLFYKSLAAELLKQGAVGLVGAQVDVPAVFAAMYACRVFNEFFARNEAPVRLGPLLRKVNQSFWDNHNNPLGLVYSLYRGTDCHIDWQIK